MTSYHSRALFETLLRCESEADVVRALQKASLWDDPTLWRDLGDEPENYSTVGNQQARPEQALVEKLVNAIDTKLMAEAAQHGGLTETDGAPRTMLEARERFFGEALKKPDELARSITVAATGARSPDRMCLTIADDGEGQTPLAMPVTILSVLKGSKKKVNFVQGRFHMGGTGVLEFCGRVHNVQLALSRRNPALLALNAEPIESLWSWTLIRREDPGQGHRRTSRFTFLAPGEHDAQGRRQLLMFAAPTFPIFPEQNQPYARQSAWGTLFKLYEYDLRAKTNIIRRDGLMQRVRIMLPEPALPVRFYECREFAGHSGSYDTTMRGLIPLLDDDLQKGEASRNVEWRDRFEMDVEGELFTGRIYLFKSGKAAESYKQSEGIVFTNNGQTQAVFEKGFFRKASVRQDYLASSLLIFIDCSQISPRAQEQLFMPSRDRLRHVPLRDALEQALEEKLRNHPKLRQAVNERRERERASAPEVSESFRKFIEDMVKRHPMLASLLGSGLSIKNPHKPMSVTTEKAPWIGRRYPTYFHFKGQVPEKTLCRDAHLNSQVRIALETDAEDTYFSRDEEPGRFNLVIWDGEAWVRAKNWKSPNLDVGLANFSFALPPYSTVGDVLRFEAVIEDPVRLEPFRLPIELMVRAERRPTVPNPSPSPTPVPRPPSEKHGQGRQAENRLAIPEPEEVTEKDWSIQDPPFDKHTAVVIKALPGDEDGSNLYVYKVNMDNTYLLAAIKQRQKQAADFRAKFKLGMTILALAVVHHEIASPPKRVKTDEDSLESTWSTADQVALFTKAMAPFLLPMVAGLATLDDGPEDDLHSLSAGEAA